MSLELVAVPLALVAGVAGVLSPCVWPLVPVVVSSSATSGRSGPVFLAAGMALSFAVAGTFLTFLLVSTGLDPELFRYVAATLLLGVALVLLLERLSAWVSLRLSSISGRFGGAGGSLGTSAPGQFGVGALLGVVWLPCVGPTLGAAIALASMGQSIPMAFTVMLAYGIGTAGVLLSAGLLSGRFLMRWRSTLMSSGEWGRKVLGWTLAGLGVLVLTGMDKYLEALALDLVPAWVYSL